MEAIYVSDKRNYEIIQFYIWKSEKINERVSKIRFTLHVKYVCDFLISVF